MKCHLVSMLLLTGQLLSSVILQAQGNSLAQAIEAEEAISVTANTHFGSNDLNPNNVWYAQTEDTRDGVELSTRAVQSVKSLHPKADP